MSLSFLKSSFKVNEISRGKLCFTIIALPVSSMLQAADMHILAATGILAHSHLIVWVHYRPASTVLLQFWDVTRIALDESLSEEKDIKLI